MATAPYVCFITSPERLDVEPVPRPNEVIEHMSLRQRQPVSHRKGQVNSPKESWQTIFMESQDNSASSQQRKAPGGNGNTWAGFA